ncbi:MAG: 50S ribosomal protein L39e [Candidatus ainarchaeum sp.]|nr:50S ribosomal protein L39e [Candidatus ainarchaeum sp.]
MPRVKSDRTKSRLGKAAKRNRRIPLFVVAKTKRRVTVNPLQRNWRRSKLDLKKDD